MSSLLSVAAMRLMMLPTPSFSSSSRLPSSSTASFSRSPYAFTSDTARAICDCKLLIFCV